MLRTARTLIKRIPIPRAVASSHWYQTFRHRLALALQKRGSMPYTNFLRARNQFDALTEVVVDRLAPAGIDRDLEIVVLGCSNGSEPYSIASALAHERPALRFRIRAADIDPQLIEHARRAEYRREEVAGYYSVDAGFAARTFDVRGDLFVVKPEIARHVSFAIGDIFSPDLSESFGSADVIFAQNVLFHFRPRAVRRAFSNILRLLRPGGTLFIDGMDLGLRSRLSRKYGLIPLDFRLQAIHEDARVMRGDVWPWVYWGLEPYMANHPDRIRRYATIFFMPAASPSPVATMADQVEPTSRAVLHGERGTGDVATRGAAPG